MFMVILFTILAGSHAQQLLPTPNVIVLLGDSYASGNGAGNYVGVEGCLRSTTTWGAQFAQMINPNATFINRGCSGGVFADITNKRYLGSVNKVNGTCPIPPTDSDEFYADTGAEWCERWLQPQLSTLNNTPSVDLVLFGMGGNDMQFGTLVRKCLIFGLRDASDCQDQINFVRNNAARWTQQLVDLLLAMKPFLKPTARVVVEQYPHIVLNTPFTFDEIFGWGSIEITNNLRSLGTVLDDSQRTAIAKANNVVKRQFVLYHDEVKALFEGHEPHPSAFTDNGASWIYENQYSVPITDVLFHLNPTGHTELAKSLSSFLEQLPPTTSYPTSKPILAPTKTPTKRPRHSPTVTLTNAPNAPINQCRTRNRSCKLSSSCCPKLKCRRLFPFSITRRCRP